jgi:hypothetical protein
MKTSYSGSEFLALISATKTADGLPVLNLDGVPIAPDVPINLRASEVAALMVGSFQQGWTRGTARPGVRKSVIRDDAGRITSLLEEPVTIVDTIP